mgnify:FL=1
MILHINASFSGAYTADPIDVRTDGVVASEETGSSISTFVAVLKDVRYMSIYYNIIVAQIILYHLLGYGYSTIIYTIIKPNNNKNSEVNSTLHPPHLRSLN